MQQSIYAFTSAIDIMLDVTNYLLAARLFFSSFLFMSDGMTSNNSFFAS